MIKYTGYSVTFQEVPNEVTLVITISNCQGTCEGCHSPWLRQDIGRNLKGDLLHLLRKYQDAVTCVCFMGDGNDPDDLRWCIKTAKSEGFKTALYTGKEFEPSADWLQNSFTECFLDYLKVGPYRKDLGGLDSSATNQHMYRIESCIENCGIEFKLEDITSQFQVKRSDVL